jgi:hypothetical protein
MCVEGGKKFKINKRVSTFIREMRVHNREVEDNIWWYWYGQILIQHTYVLKMECG